MRNDIKPQPVRFLNKTFGPFLIGVATGCVIITLLVELQYWNDDYKADSQISSDIFSIIRGFNKSNHPLEDYTIANKLYDEVKVLCFVITTKPERAIEIRNTWGSRCNKLIMTNTTIDSQLNEIVLNVTKGLEWENTKDYFKYVYENDIDDYDWFLKAEEDTYVIVENLRHLLYPHSAKSPIYFGFKITNIVEQGYMAGGPGYVLSREAVRRFIEVAIPNAEQCPPGNSGLEDVNLGQCLQYAGVIAGDSKDSAGVDRFSPYFPVIPTAPDSHENSWLWTSMLSRNGSILSSCSPEAISFHYVRINDMYIIDYLIYSLQPYGIVKFPSKLPVKYEINVNTKNSNRTFK